MELLLKNLKIAPLYFEIFNFTRKENSVLYKMMKSGNFGGDLIPKVRKRNKSFEVLTNVDVVEVSQRLAAEAVYPQVTISKVECREIEASNEEAIIIMLYDAVNLPSSYSQMSQFQIYFLSQLYSKFSGRQIPKEALKKSTKTFETSFQNLQVSVNFTIAKLKEKYAEKYAELTRKYEGDKIYGKLTELKLIEYATAQNELTEFCDFIHGKMKVGRFYNKVYKKIKVQ